MLRLVYRALWWIVAPLAVVRLWWRGRFEPGYRRHIGERFGFYDAPPYTGRPLIWVHAVSVGETRAAQPLIEALLERYPSHGILLTHMTPTGRAIGENLFGERVQRCYLPYDMVGPIRRFLKQWRPSVGLVMETEVWPNLVLTCREDGVPLVLTNARMSARSFRRAARFGEATRPIFGGFSRVFAQSDADAERLRMLGAHDVDVLGNLKFDMTPPAQLLALGARWRERFGARKVWFAASTRDGEEALVLQARAMLAAASNVGRQSLLLLVPRHPQRFDEVAAMLDKVRLNYVRRSAWPDDGTPLPAHIDVVLGDSMGEMPAYFSAADVAFIGGSLLPLGGQNLIEACAAGTPVVFGPHMFNFTQASENALAAGAARRVSDAGELAAALADVLVNDDRRLAMRTAATLFAKQHQGATARTVAALGRWLDKPGLVQ
ncbi:lipid IV(A) 3-deoxy-D-manno-octulosonic acid transferase [Pandoraea pulmonicola]|uniref:3-deoxy-D-manno-octulosonic acid transferase n=1 Tax=Pandoraea pulmonicola TaxID=93221 RepID=A0ABN4U8B2_PANPU|nr:lipid IV(A) 3-deoxy-D-manno-octulosonic acid transferase [Pandoraea pulmonicola]APD13792.1 3-deoxy-D-manno-octulosonic acid transferase [Pandoraea pulmonicola]